MKRMVPGSLFNEDSTAAAVRDRVHGESDAERHLTLMGVAPEEGMVGGGRDITPADVERVAALVPEKAVARFDIIADVPLLCRIRP